MQFERGKETIVNRVTPPEIGPRLHRYRKELNLTLSELALLSGISRSVLSEIERGNANPTYGTLWHLTRALGIDLNRLVSSASEERAGPRIDLQPENLTPTIRSADGSCTLQILSPANMVSVIEWYLLNFETDGKLVSVPHGCGTVEHLHCTRGEIVVHSADDTMSVRAGETARYVADVPHSLTSVGPVGASAFLVVASASVGAGAPRAPVGARQ